MTLILNRQASSAHWTIHDSPRVEPTVRTAPATRGEWEVVTRRVERSPENLHGLLADHAWTNGRVIPLGEFGILSLDAPFDPVRAAELVGWAAAGRLVARRPWFSRVDVEIWPWSADAVELRVAPRSRRVDRWDARSRRRYFAQAHAAADALVRILGPAACSE